MSLPFLSKKPIDLPQIVSIELIQITDKTNIPFAPKAKKIIEEVKKKKEKLVSEQAPPPRCYHSATLLGKNLFVTGGQVHFWLLAHTHYIHGAYILEIVKNQWEHNTIKGDSFIPYPGCSL